MEAQRIFSGLSSTLPTNHSPFQNQKVPFFQILKTPSAQNNLTLKGYYHYFSSLATEKAPNFTNCLQKIESGVVTTGNNSVSKKEITKKNFAVFVSGGGSNFRSIYEATVEGSVHGEVAVLVTNKHDCGGAKYARDKGIPIILFPKTKDSTEGSSGEELVAALRTYNIDYILLAGYLKLIPTELVQAFPRSILNIHPSLLPAFGGKGYYGIKVHKAVISSGARYSGPTIHYVDEHYDTGRILAQKAVPVLANDTAETLAARVLQEEHKLYVEVAAALCEERIVWREDGVPLIQSKEDPSHYT